MNKTERDSFPSTVIGKCCQCGSSQCDIEIFEGNLCVSCFEATAQCCYFCDGDFICLSEAADKFARECGAEEDINFPPDVLRNIWKYVKPVVETDNANNPVMPHILVAKDNLSPRDFHHFLWHHHVGWGPDGSCRIKSLTVDFPEMRNCKYSEQ